MIKSTRFSEEDLRALKQRMQGSGRKEAMPSTDRPRVIASAPAHIRQPRHPALYRSKWESAYASKLELEQHAGLISAYWYEPFSLWLPGQVRYKPDFMIQYPSGLERSLEIIEVKGWSRNLRDGITRMKIAAALFPCFTWVKVSRAKNGGWDETRIG